MVRLMWKELTYNWWLTFAACGVGLLLLLSGDPIFWSDALSLKSFWLMTVALLLGLRAYSTELGGDTVQFLGSRPIQWWQVWIAKFASGLLQVAIISTACGLIYAVMAPVEYRSFMAPALEEGVFKGIWLLGLSYTLGFSTSVLMPGVPLSLASLVMTLILMAIPATILAQIGRADQDGKLARFASAMGDNTAVLCIILAPIGSMVIAHALARLSAQGRWIIAVSFLLVCAVLGVVTAGIWGHIEPSKNDPDTNCLSLSPDGRWAVYSVTKDKHSHTYLIDTTDGKRSLELLDVKQVGHTWSQDSSKLAYWGRNDQIRIIYTRPGPSLGPLVRVQADTGPVASQSIALSWSPSGDRLAVTWMHSTRGQLDPTYGMAVIRPDIDKAVSAQTVKLEGMDAVRSAPSELPAIVVPQVLFWSSNDGGRYTSLESGRGKQN